MERKVLEIKKRKNLFWLGEYSADKENISTDEHKEKLYTFWNNFTG